MIQINVCRVSSDGKYIDLNIQCAEDHKFTSLTVYNFNDSQRSFDFSKLFMDAAGTIKNQSKYVLRIPTAILAAEYPMYKLVLKVEPRNINKETITDECNNPVAVAVCSDVSAVYKYLIGQLLPLLCVRCLSEIPVDIQRIFIILHAHLMAMRYERYDDAYQFLKVLINNFHTVCGASPCGDGMNRPVGHSCGCHAPQVGRN